MTHPPPPTPQAAEGEGDGQDWQDWFVAADCVAGVFLAHCAAPRTKMPGFNHDSRALMVLVGGRVFGPEPRAQQITRGLSAGQNGGAWLLCAAFVSHLGLDSCLLCAVLCLSRASSCFKAIILP